jgi:hypothetical protein
MVAHTSLIRVWLAPSTSDISAHRNNAVLTVGVRGPFTQAMTAMVDMKSPSAGKTSGGFDLPMPAAVFVDEHVLAGPDETDLRWMSVADVIVRRAGSSKAGPRSVSDIRTRFPGCLVAALIDSDRSCVWAGAPGRQLRFVSLPESRPSKSRAKCKGAGADADFLGCASVIHAWLVAGRPLAELDTAHLIVSRGPATPRRRVRVSLAHRNLDADEKTVRQVGC